MTMPHNATPAFQPPHQAQEAHLIDYINIILRRRRTFLTAFLAVFLYVAFYTLTMKPLFQASATLHLKQEIGKGELFNELLLFDQSNRVDAELEILKSRTNAEKVVKLLHLDWEVSKKSRGLEFKLLEFSATAKDPTYQVELTGTDSYRVKDDDGDLIGTGKAGILMQGKGITLLIADLHGKAGDSFRLHLLPFNGTAAGLRSGIKAVEVGKRTNVIQVSYLSNDPQLAREVVNTLVQVYLDQTIAFKTEEAGRTVGFVAEQLQGLRIELDQSEKNLQAYKSKSGVIKLDTEADELVKKLSETEKARAALALEKKQAEFAITALREAKRRGGTYTPAVMRNDPAVVGLAGKVVELEVQKRALLTEYTESHPAVKSVQGQIDELQKKLRDMYETSLKNLTKQEGAVTQQLAGYEEGLRRLPEAERELARLTRLSRVNADIYTLLLKKHEEARITKASTISNINIVDPAIAPDRPVKPTKQKNLILGLLIGCMIGVGLAFFHDYMDDTIKDPEEAQRTLGLPFLAAIPYIAHKGGGRKNDIRETLVTHLEPKSVSSEAYRSLRTALHFSIVTGRRQVILVTSTFNSEGKSTTAANLALVMAQAGNRVLLMDCDLRRPTLHDQFGHSKSPGLTDLLAGDCDLTGALHVTSIPSFDLLSAGTIPPNPAELLGSDAMHNLLAEFRERFDTIVIDSPPVLTVTDAPLLAAMADEVLVVLEAGRVPVKAARRMVELLSAVQGKVAGIVMNCTSREEYSHYGSQYGGYYYQPGYGPVEEKAEEKVGWKLWRRWVKK